DYVTVARKKITPKSILVSGSSVAVREDHQRKSSLANRGVTMRFVPVDLVDFSGAHLVGLANQIVDLGSYSSRHEIGGPVIRQTPGLVGCRIPDLSDKCSRLFGEIVGATFVDKDSGGDSDGKRTCGHRIGDVSFGRSLHTIVRRNECYNNYQQG